MYIGKIISLASNAQSYLARNRIVGRLYKRGRGKELLIVVQNSGYKFFGIPNTSHSCSGYNGIYICKICFLQGYFRSNDPHFYTLSHSSSGCRGNKVLIVGFYYWYYIVFIGSYFLQKIIVVKCFLGRYGTDTVNIYFFH